MLLIFLFVFRPSPSWTRTETASLIRVTWGTPTLLLVSTSVTKLKNKQTVNSSSWNKKKVERRKPAASVFRIISRTNNLISSSAEKKEHHWKKTSLPWLNFCWLMVLGLCISVQVALTLATMSWTRWWRRLRVQSTSPSSWPCSERSWKVGFGFGRPENVPVTPRRDDAFDSTNLPFSFRHWPRGNHPQRLQGVRPRRKGHSQRRRVGVLFSAAQSRPPHRDPCTLFFRGGWCLF